MFFSNPLFLVKDQIKTIKNSVVVLGTGSIGAKHLKVLQGVPDVEVSAISVRPERRLELETNGLLTFRDLDEAQLNDVDTCIVATDTKRHVEDTKKALSLGMSVLVEKPMGLAKKDAMEVIRAIKSPQVVGVGCCLRFSESMQIFKKNLSKIGDVSEVDIESRSYLPHWRPERPYKETYSARVDEGGVLRDMIHEIDYAGWLFGWPSEVEGKLSNSNVLGIKSEEEAIFKYMLTSGTQVSIHLDYITKASTRKMTARGSLGVITWDWIKNNVELEILGEKKEIFNVTQTREGMLAAQWKGFSQTMRGTRHSSIATARDGVRALAVCDAVRASSIENKSIKVDYIGIK